MSRKIWDWEPGRRLIRHKWGAFSLALLLLTVAAGIACRELVDEPGQPAETGAKTVDLEVVEGSGGATPAFIPVTIQGEGPFPFAPDTGASTSVIDRPIVERLGIPVTGPPREVAGIGGTATARAARLEDRRIGDVPLRPREIAAIELAEPQEGQGLAGLIGSDILSDFRTIEIDYETGQLTLQPR